MSIDAPAQHELERCPIRSGPPADHLGRQTQVLRGANSRDLGPVGKHNIDRGSDPVLQTIASYRGHVGATTGNQDRES
jgi:hypothetical protein